MEEYSIFDYSILRDLIINAGKNVYGVQYFINFISGIYIKIICCIIVILLTIGVLLLTYKIFKNRHTKITKNTLKITINELREKYKKILIKLRYLLIGFILTGFNRFFINLFFYYILNRIPQVNYQLAPKEQPRFLGTLSLQALLYFTIGAYFIGFSFGNKFVRNIGIFVYIIGISIIFLGILGHLGFYVPIE